MSFRHLHVPGTSPSAAIDTPCVKICVIEADGLCVGCARTLDEIARWGLMSAEQRHAVMTALPGRRTEIAPKID
jgi:uncharacterized protein